MIQNKMSQSHRYIANGASSSFNNAVPFGGITSMHNTVAKTLDDFSTPAILIALDKLNAKNILVSYTCQLSGSQTTDAPRAHFTTFVTSGTPSQVDSKTNSVGVPLTAHYFAADTQVSNLEGQVVIPILETEPDEVQYVALCLVTADHDGYIMAQMTAYSEEYQFFQPLK